MRTYKDTYIIKKINKTNGCAWCIFEDKFGVSRVALISGEWSEIERPTKALCVVVTAKESEKTVNCLVVLSMITDNKEYPAIDSLPF